jgi:phospholipid transport system substrate-binding protein
MLHAEQRQKPMPQFRNEPSTPIGGKMKRVFPTIFSSLQRTCAVQMRWRRARSAERLSTGSLPLVSRLENGPPNDRAIEQPAGPSIATRKLRTLIVLPVILTAQYAGALPVQPHEVVNDVVQRVMSKVNSMDVSAVEDGRRVLEVFEQEISPHLDFHTITRWLAGERWSDFADDEKHELTAVVRGHIVQVYAALLARGRSVEIEVEPASVVRTHSAKVSASMATREGREFSVEFRLIRSDDSWKLYDLAVEGLSFARSLRAELAPVIDAGGVEGLKTYLDSRQ